MFLFQEMEKYLKQNPLSMLGERISKPNTEMLYSELDKLYDDCTKGTAISFDGTPVHYTAVGEGPALIVCNGVWNTYGFFHYMKDHFKSRCKFIVFDYRCHGRSGIPDDEKNINMRAFAEDMKAVLDDLGVEKAVLLGFSMGVMVILEFFNVWQDRVSALVPMDGPYEKAYSIVFPNDAMLKAFNGLLGFAADHPWMTDWSKLIINMPINYYLARLIEVNSCCPRKEMDLYFKHITSVDYRYGFLCLKAMGEFDLPASVLSRIDVPTLIMCGDSDTWSPLKNMEKLRSMIEGAEFTVIPRGSHATPIENPEMVNMRIDLFLRDHGIL